MNTKLKQVGLLGGTFDPVHIGHLGLAKETLRQFNLDKILFIPVNQSPHKLHERPTASEHRVAMLELALEQEAAFSLELMEVNKGGVSYTIETLHRIKSENPDWELYLILGADAFITMDTWKNFNEIFEICHVLVGTRPDIKLVIPTKLGKTLGVQKSLLQQNNYKLPVAVELSNGKTIQLYKIPPQDLSSREIRQKLEAGKEIKNLLPPAVDHYIMQNRLYRTESPPIKV